MKPEDKPVRELFQDSTAKCDDIDKMIQSENTSIRNWIDDLVALKLYYKSINSDARLD